MLAAQIKQRRMQQKMTQSELGIHLGVIKQTISSWETGHSNPTHEQVAKMADLFGITVSEIYGRFEKSSLYEDWPEVIQVLQMSGTKPTPEERRRIARIIRAALDSSDR